MSSSSSSLSSTRSRLNKSQLRKHLEILDSIPLFEIPATLPLSPPESRAGSPVPSGSLKRKLEGGLDGSNKRPRTSPGAQSISSSPSNTPLVIQNVGGLLAQLPSPPKTSSSHGSPPQVPLPDPDAPTAVPPLRNIDLELWHRRQQAYTTTATTLRRSGDTRAYRATDPDVLLTACLEQIDAMATYCYSFWLQELVLRERGQVPKDRPRDIRSWESMLLYFPVAEHRLKLATPPAERDPRGIRGRLLAIKALIFRLEAFVLTLVMRKLNSEADSLFTQLRKAGDAGSSPASNHSPKGITPPGSAPSPSAAAAAAVSAKSLDILRRTFECNARAAKCLTLASEDPLLRPDALQQTFPRTARRLLVDGRYFRELVPRLSAREELALELDVASGAMPETPANTVLEWPVSPLSAEGAGIGSLAIVLRAMLWEFGTEVGYTYTRGAIVVART